MKKIYAFLTVMLALFAINANADTKVIYQDNYSDETTSKANWTNSRGGDANTATSWVHTQDGDYMQFGNGTLSFNGTRFSSIWGTTPWNNVTLPETGYILKVSFNFAQFGNNSNAANQRNNEIAIISAGETEGYTIEGYDAVTLNTALANYWGSAGTIYTKDAGKATEKKIPIFPNYLFKLTQSTEGSAAGEGGYATAVNGTCGFYINDEKDLVTVSAAQWYVLTLVVVGQTVNYDITTLDGNPLKSGSRTLPTGADNRAGGILHYQARSLGITQIGISLQITMESDEDVANVPTVTLNQVKGNDRVYKATFADGETLHYILPGGEEQEVDYWTAEDEEGNPGTMMLTATQSGTLKAWTTKNSAKSDDVNITVSAGWIKLVDPVVTIASVSEGFGKSYTVTFNSADASHLLPVSAAITYSINSGEPVEVANGGTINMTAAGTLVVTVNQIPQGGQEYYERSSVTINNDVEYTIAMATEYINWDESHFTGNAAWESTPLIDSNTSHWQGHWYSANEYDKSEQDKKKADPNYEMQFLPGQNMVKKFYNEEGTTTGLPCYLLKNEGENYNTELLPLIPYTGRSGVSILLEEGIFENYLNGISGNNKTLEINFDPQWRSDDVAKPNFMEIRKTNNYDRYDKIGRHITDIVAIVEPAKDAYNYYLDINNTAIHSARVFTYAGFTPSTGVESIKTVKAAEDAPIFNLAGQRVNKGAKGLLIQNGKKFVVK